jgi:site-specific DNA-methyltransferase (adenine-specific)
MTRVIHGDCREVLASLPDASVDSVVTDPPYELGFMGKAWDGSGIAYEVAMWRECLRVLKPGGHLLAFGGTRTYHRMAVAIEDAGFEIRDSIHWLYGSGFPKSLNLDGEWAGWGTALKPAHEPIIVARKPLSGTVASNVLEYGTGALNIDGCRVSMSDADREAARVPMSLIQEGGSNNRRAAGRNGEIFEPAPAGRWPANLVLTHSADCGDTCEPDCPVAALDGQSGVSKSPNTVTRGGNRSGNSGLAQLGRQDDVPCYGDSGGASRFFTVTEWDAFRYVAKPGKRERNAGLDGLPEKKAGTYAQDEWSRQNIGSKPDAKRDPVANNHPTVKPLALMQWLVRLVTPPNGTVLEPFAGSGTTLAAAILEGRNAIGIELTAEYLPIIEARIEWATQQMAERLPLP